MKLKSITLHDFTHLAEVKIVILFTLLLITEPIFVYGFTS